MSDYESLEDIQSNVKGETCFTLDCRHSGCDHIDCKLVISVLVVRRCITSSPCTVIQCFYCVAYRKVLPENRAIIRI
jgi:hypothetical protein